jgi:hypothetical protein
VLNLRTPIGEEPKEQEGRSRRRATSAPTTSSARPSV